MNKNMISIGSVDITYKCNLRCLHCFNCSGEQNYVRKEMSDQELLNLMESLAKIKSLRSMCFCGGEALLRKEILLRCIEYLHRELPELSINMVSNGTLIDEDTVLELKEAGINMVQISLDGLDANVHDWIRNNEGVYDKAIKAIKLLVKYNIKVSVACLPTKSSYNDIPEIIDLVKNLGVSSFRMQPLMLLGRAKKNLNHEILSTIEYRNLARLLATKKMEYASQDFMVEWGDPIQHLSFYKDKELMYLSINAYAQIIISPYLPLVVGDLRKYSLEKYVNNGLLDIWKDEKIKKMGDMITAANKMDISERYEMPEIYTENDIVYDAIEKRKDR